MSVITKIKSEYSYLSGFSRTLRRVTAIARDKKYTFPEAIAKMAAKYPERTAIIADDRVMSYADYNLRANQYGHWAITNGVTKGDCVALLMTNCAEYLAIWLGIIRCGGAVSLVNTGIKAQALARTINITKPKHLICAKSLAPVLNGAIPHLNPDIKIWFYGDDADCQLPAQVNTMTSAQLDTRVLLNHDDHALYVYTSGTTGLPKAANINHYRLQAIAHGFSAAVRATRNDRMYVCLPLYHLSGGVLATGTVLTVGGTVIISEKFSTSTFWQDLVKHKATMFQYIGEMARYLLQAPASDYDRRHNIRICAGNGLQASVWLPFKQRFRIPKIFEWYAATESNCILLNFDGKPGALGRIPNYIKKRFSTELIMISSKTQQPVRDRGFCVGCEPGDVGEAIAEISIDPNRPGQRFEGYLDNQASKARIIHDVFRKGDAWFRSGDLMRRDAQGYYYFIDRLSGSFRWKGENVSAQEVATTLDGFAGVKSACVYGVEIPRHEGKAGMAALLTDDTFEIDHLPGFLEQNLASYARPAFIRLINELPTTSTMKLTTTSLKRSGFNPSLIGDPLYFFDKLTGLFVPITMETFQNIINNEISF